MEQYIGYDIPAKFLEVDEESERLVFSHRRASSSADMQGYKVGGWVPQACVRVAGCVGVVGRCALHWRPVAAPCLLPAAASTNHHRPNHRLPLPNPNPPIQPQPTTEPTNPPPPQPKQVGDVVVGVVQSVRPYGAFVDIGGAIGLLHISQITHERLTTVDQVLAEGDKLKVMILSQDSDRGRVTLSTKKLEPSPGDMLRDPQKVFENADKMAEMFKQRVAAADGAVLGSLDGAEYAAMGSLDGGYPAPGAGYGEGEVPV